MYAYAIDNYAINSPCARIVIPVTIQDIEEAGIKTIPLDRHDCEQIQIEAVFWYNEHGMRQADIRLSAPIIKDLQGKYTYSGSIRGDLLLHHRRIKEKALDMCLLRHLARKKLGEAAFNAVMERAKSDFRDWTD